MMAEVQPLLEAAQHAATAIMEEAEVRARRHVEETRAQMEALAAERARDMLELTDGLIERAEAVKELSDDLLRTLTMTRRGLEPFRSMPPEAES